MTKAQFKEIEKLLQTIDIELYSWDDVEDIEDIDQLEEFLQDNNLLDVEITYHSKAMEYLTEHDTSLSWSLRIAADMGFETKNLNSEILASLLASEKMREDFGELRKELEEIL